MRIGVDAWRLQGVQAGLYRYITNILRHWDHDLVNDQIEKINIYSPLQLDLSTLKLPEHLVHKVLKPNLQMLLWQNFCLGLRADDDVIWYPSYTRSIFTNTRTVVTTHEAISARFPERFSMLQRHFYNPLYGWSARNATLVITDSIQAKNDIVRYWHVPDEKIRVVYMAATEVFHPVSDRAFVENMCKNHIGSNDPFFLFVGKFSGRRSMPLLLEAFGEFKKQKKTTHKLALVGSNIHNLDMMSMLEKCNIKNEVVFLYKLSDEGLNALYNGADAYVSPAVYEPVSLPVMEALASGCPVICLDQPGMREIAGESACFINDASVNELEMAMEKIADSRALRDELADSGLEQSRKFSWKKCSSGILDVLTEAAS